MKIDVTRLSALGFDPDLLRVANSVLGSDTKFLRSATRLANSIEQKFPEHVRYVEHLDPSLVSHSVALLLLQRGTLSRIFVVSELVDALFNFGEEYLKNIVPYQKSVRVMIQLNERNLSKLNQGEQSALQAVLPSSPRFHPMTIIAPGPLEGGDLNFRFALGPHNPKLLKQVEF